MFPVLFRKGVFFKGIRRDDVTPVPRSVAGIQSRIFHLILAAKFRAFARSRHRRRLMAVEHEGDLHRFLNVERFFPPRKVHHEGAKRVYKRSQFKQANAQPLAQPNHALNTEPKCCFGGGGGICQQRIQVPRVHR